MRPSDYVAASQRTENMDMAGFTARFNSIDKDGIDHARLAHAIFGIVTEAGELMTAYKNWIIYGKPLDKVNLLEEIGDLEWYQALALRTLDSSYEAVWATNIEKLKARYPVKFAEWEALNRDLDAERQKLEAGHGPQS